MAARNQKFEVQNAPIGVFDSGIGGLTVVAALRRLLPGENLIYLGDTARVPYGTKSAETISRFAQEDAGFLTSRGVKLVIVACHSASSVALAALSRRLAVPTIGVIEPGARALVAATKRDRVAVIGTAATIRSAAYERAIRKLRPRIEIVATATPLLVPLAEEGWVEGMSNVECRMSESGIRTSTPAGAISRRRLRNRDPEVAPTRARSRRRLRTRDPEVAPARARSRRRLQNRDTEVAPGGSHEFRASDRGKVAEMACRYYLAGLTEEGVDALLLGCTHFPLLAGIIGRVLGPRVRLVDSSEETAGAAAALLESRGLLRRGGPGRLRIYLTDLAPSFETVGARFLGMPLGEVIRATVGNED